jgi:glycosyltransferase involved in cell wall biosynthesis
VTVEAMACGTPTIAWDAGSTREVIDEGVSGVIVRSIEEAVDAVRLADKLPRTRVHKMFERRFSAITMSKNYLRLYSRIARSETDIDPSAGSPPQERAAAAHGALRA